MRSGFLGLLLAACTLSGCDGHDAASGASPKSPGRYAGIGIFEPGRLWQETIGAPTPKDPAAARVEDDEHVIVVIDSHTGEVRQCGDHSGFCVAMNPWPGAGSAATGPVKLKKHEADLIAEDKAASDEANKAAEKAAPAR